MVADVCASVKARGERFDSDDQLRSFSDEGGIECDSQSLDAAVGSLEWAGRIRRPRHDHWNPDLPLPGQYVEPRFYKG